jgi:hypothetical protein
MKKSVLAVADGKKEFALRFSPLGFFINPFFHEPWLINFSLFASPLFLTFCTTHVTL